MILWLYLELGFSSIRQYAEKFFGYQHAHTYECLRVAEALENLPSTASAFDRGQISWCAVKEITQVASKETEEEEILRAALRSGRETRQA